MYIFFIICVLLRACNALRKQCRKGIRRDYDHIHLQRWPDIRFTYSRVCCNARLVPFLDVTLHSRETQSRQTNVNL